MKQSIMKKRTVNFFEIVEVVGDEPRRMDQQDWPSVLSLLSRADLDRLTWEGQGRPLIGQVYTLEDEDRLVLHRLRDPGDWMSTVDFKSKSIAEVEASAGSGFLDSSAIQFGAFGNVIALMQGAVGAPGAVALEGWLNHLDPWNCVLKVRPLVTPAERERLKKATEVSRFELKLGAQQRRALRGKGGSLGRFLSRKLDIDDVTVTVVISVPRGRRYSEARHELAAQLSELVDVIPEAAEIARATVYHGPESALSAAHITELVTHQITAKANVPSVDEHGNSIRIRGAFHVMDSLFFSLDEQLRTAADV